MRSPTHRTHPPHPPIPPHPHTPKQISTPRPTSILLASAQLGPGGAQEGWPP
jgi:hypothetical protein